MDTLKVIIPLIPWSLAKEKEIKTINSYFHAFFTSHNSAQLIQAFGSAMSQKANAMLATFKVNNTAYS